MDAPKIFESEYRFCLILWEHEPIKSSELVALCKEKLGWKSSTTYTVIKRLSDRGVLKNENTIVTSLISKNEAQTAEIEELVEKKFDNSLPSFIAAFTRHRKVTENDIDEIQQIIDRFRQGGAL
ncbi:MAG: BlaI/MecI/CopY family transcriptional regulator [Lachnospiraceae bacterium]|nr:BlaI/MecI/CopY family transcriptional regulator [Lachnospiraceae bacterium]